MVSTISKENSASNEQISQDIVQAVQAMLDKPEFLKTINTYMEKIDLGNVEEFEDTIHELLVSSNSLPNKPASSASATKLDIAPTITDKNYWAYIIPAFLITTVISAVISESIKQLIAKKMIGKEKGLEEKIKNLQEENQRLMNENNDERNDTESQSETIDLQTNKKPEKPTVLNKTEQSNTSSQGVVVPDNQQRQQLHDKTIENVHPESEKEPESKSNNSEKQRERKEFK